VRWIGHPILSFDFGNDQHIAFSIEARYKVGQAYSAILGFFRQYELIFVVADERDVIRLRTNYRRDEEVHLYRGTLGPEEAREMFLAYVQYLNQLKSHPEWYNAATRNCTTTLDRQLAAKVARPQPWKLSVPGERYIGRIDVRPRPPGHRRTLVRPVEGAGTYQSSR